ncbi:SMC-Scp complex subunit ScpB [Calderihabitans maritimus]|uniref:Segregation and condensation protein B n=1 Tax=Calderihabitans maritimus TaxID=1246530 RepID=A0A1Z5HWK1_9FIRM|nr:SMC-Scp complex subunit ScpB [Calderihabitans maritimus]GAW93912.1 chromosome segregation and condensation protein ScpB [Calderihabitans maritimus]
MDSGEAKAVIECLLFVAREPLTLKTIGEIVGMKEKEVRQLLEELMQSYNNGSHGIRLLEVANGYQFCTRPEFASYIEKLYQPQIQMLSKAALETLAIIAYKQPITRAEIETIRGVKSDRVISTLLERRLIQEVGRREGPGRPILYGTTDEFLRSFGLKSLEELPNLEELAACGREEE